MSATPYDRELIFFSEMLEQYNLPVHLLRENAEEYPCVDLGLRTLLNPKYNRNAEIRLLMNMIGENTVYRVTDEFMCSYVFLRLPDSNPSTVLSIGPYTNTEVTRSKLMLEAREQSLHPNWLPILEKYFSSVVYMSNEKPIYIAVNTLASKLWEGNFNSETIASGKLRQHPALFSAPMQNAQETTEFNIKIIESRYEAENRLMEAISSGRTHKVETMLSHFTKSAVEERAAEPTRNARNYLIILNTIMRKAAQQGSVHPLHIDRVSSTFARKIESVNSWDDIAPLCREMANKYCDLVNKYSLEGYSSTVQKVISRIDFDLTADLSLKATADAIGVNASYLSTLFKKETNCTVTDFVANKRIEHAVFLLKNTDMPVSVIGQHCGISDNNYFTKIFKKHTGKTPMQFRNDYRLKKSEK